MTRLGPIRDISGRRRRDVDECLHLFDAGQLQLQLQP